MFTFLRRKRSGRAARGLRRTAWRPHLEALEDRLVPSGFVDGFEGPILDPFWTVAAYSGAVQFPSTANVHGGSQSVELGSNNSGGVKEITLSHSFGAPTFGRVSVWMYDTGADVASSNYIMLRVGSLDYPGQYFGISTWDYDLGPGNNG